MIKSLVRALFADMILFKIRDGFNIVNEPFSIGKQLDCIGEWVGVDRIYDAGQPLYPWYSYIDWDNITIDDWQGGFQDWDDPIIEDGGFLGFEFFFSLDFFLEFLFLDLFFSFSFSSSLSSISSCSFSSFRS